MNSKLTIVFVFLVVLNAFAQSDSLRVLEFSLLRQDDSIFYAQQPVGFYNKLKSTDFGPINISIGGAFRNQYEYFKNEDFEPKKNEFGWYLQRILSHADLNTESGFRLYGELGYSNIFGKRNLSPVDLNELYVNQLFFEYHNDKNLAINLGRKNIRFGSGRLIDVREGPNIRQSFDGIDIMNKFDWLRFRSFYAVPVKVNRFAFDDEAFHDEESVWGVYASTDRLFQKWMFDLYYLGINYKENEYYRGVGQETRHSVGLRFNRNQGVLNFDNEFVYQFGYFNDIPISAWTTSFHLWHKSRAITYGFKTELISGDERNGALGTFNALYPRGAYFGRVARFGPSNLIDFHPYIKYTKKKLHIELDYDHFLRFSTNDGIYGPALNLVFDPQSTSNERNIAGQIGTITNYEFNKFVYIELETNYIIVMDYIKDVVADERNLFHLVLTSEIRF